MKAIVNAFRPVTRAICGAIARSASLIVATIGAATCTWAQGADEASFYKGKNVSMFIGFDVGGGYDVVARLLAPALATHLPGNPTVVPINRPGAGSMVAALHIYHAAPRDGTALATVGRSVALQPLLVPDKADFDARELSWIGSVGRDTLLCVSWHTSQIRSLKDMQTKSFSVGGSGTGSDTTVQAQALRRLLGMQVKLVGPYRGTADINLAMERGEVDGYCGFSWSTLKSQNADWLREKKVNVLLQLALEKNPDLPDVPIIGDLLDADKKRVFQLLVGTQNVARPFFAPPGLPLKRKQTLRAAFNAAVADSRFQSEAKRLALEVELMRGEEIDTTMQALYATPKDLVAQASALMR